MKAIRAGARAARKEAVMPSSIGFDRGWRPMSSYSFGGLGDGSRPAQIKEAINTYGGTDQSSATVFSCVTLIADTLAGYEYGIADPEGDLLPPSAADQELHDLLNEPWPEATYTDFAGDVWTDMEMVGNSWWYKREMNAMGQPLQLNRLTPGNVRIVTNNRDEKIGYVYRVQGVDIPFGMDEVIHYKMRNPLNRHYGMGTVEALIREIQSDLSQAAHVMAFFTNGARIAGVLTIPDGMDEVQFERLKDEIASEYGSAENAYKMLIAEKATDFKSISQPPAAAGVVELRKLAKDAILQGFNVPEFLLGGTAQGGIPKMEQAQFVFYRRMLTRAQKFQDRTSLSLAAAWEGRKFILFPELNEPPEQKANYAAKIAEACASPNEVRVAAGLPEIDDERMDMPLLPTALSPLGIVFQGPQGQDGGDPATQAPPGKSALEGVKAPRRIRPHTKRVGPLRLPPGIPPKAALDPRVVQAMTQAVLAGTPGVVDGTAVEMERPALPETTGQAAEILALVQEAEQQLLEAPPEGDPTAASEEVNADSLDDIKLLIETPELPHGYEQRAQLIDPGEATVVAAQQILQGQSDFFFKATPRMFATFVAFFQEQRMRVLGRMDGFRSANGRAKAATDKKDLERDSLWNADTENDALKAVYLKILDELGPQAIAVPRRVVSADLAWDVQHEYVASAREALAELVVRINDTTRKQIADVVEEGVRRGYSIARIANGFADEGYKGIQGIFNEATAARAETIARSETAMLYNRSAAAAYRTAGIGKVQIYDGEGDPGCADAAGQIWTVDFYEANPIEHPNCVRTGAPVSDSLEPDAY